MGEERLPDVSELFEHELHYDRFWILSALCREMIEKFDLLDKGKNFLSFKSPCFLKIVQKYRSEFQVEDGEFEAVFEFVKRGDHTKEPFFVFKIRKLDLEQGIFFVDVGRSESKEFHTTPFSEREKVFISKGYEPGIYCRLTANSFYFSLLSTDF